MSGKARSSATVRRQLLVAVTAAIAAVAWAAAPAQAADPCPGRYGPSVDVDEDLVRVPVRADEAAARRGRFSLIDRPAVSLAAPVNWAQDPFGSEAWRSKLHAMEWLDPLLTLHGRDPLAPGLGAGTRSDAGLDPGQPPHRRLRLGRQDLRRAGPGAGLHHRGGAVRPHAHRRPAHDPAHLGPGARQLSDQSGQLQPRQSRAGSGPRADRAGRLPADAAGRRSVAGAGGPALQVRAAGQPRRGGQPGAHPQLPLPGPERDRAGPRASG